LGGFARRLETDWLRVLGRFVASFAGLLVVWTLAAPVYAALLAAIGGLVAPSIERTPAAAWRAEGTRVVALRPIADPGGGTPITLRQGIWDARTTFSPALLAAALVATPGWTAARRRRALAIGLGALFLVHLANLLVNAMYTAGRPLARDGVLLQQGGSYFVQVTLNALSYFFDTMGPAFFTIAIYTWLIASSWYEPGEHRQEPVSDAVPHAGRGPRRRRRTSRGLRRRLTVDSG
jgi:hypothetical protein